MPVPPLTVRGLKELLKGLPKECDDFEIVAEGCDCTGEAYGILVMVKGEKVEVARTTIGLDIATW